MPAAGLARRVPGAGGAPSYGSPRAVIGEASPRAAGGRGGKLPGGRGGSHRSPEGTAAPPGPRAPPGGGGPARRPRPACGTLGCRPARARGRFRCGSCQDLHPRRLLEGGREASAPPRRLHGERWTLPAFRWAGWGRPGVRYPTPPGEARSVTRASLIEGGAGGGPKMLLNLKFSSSVLVKDPRRSPQGTPKRNRNSKV